jgi:P-type Ca2+ transporter type 2C
MKTESSSTIRVVHQVRGRARLAVPGLYRSEAVAGHLNQVLPRSLGIRRVSPNALTGNLLVLFAEPHSIDTVLSLVDGVVREFESLRPGDTIPRSLGGLSPLPDESSKKTEQLFIAGAEDSASQGPDEPLSPWHFLEPTQAASHFGASLEHGLTHAAVRSRQLQYGWNALPGMAARPFLAIAKAQVISLPILLIGASAGLSVATGRMAGGLLALGVALVNAAVGCVTEYRAERSLDVVKQAVQLQAVVFREGELKAVPFDEVVPGDVIDLQVGSRVPADARVVNTNGLSVDESALTGESIPVAKSAAKLQPADHAMNQRRNMVYRGTLVVEGSGRALVVAIGENTVLGRLQGFLGEVFPPEALVAKDMRQIARHLIVLGFGTSVLCLGICLLRGPGLLSALRQSLSLFAGALPSGLSTLAISAFALGHREISRNRVLVRRLRALGSLASIQVVCFDKTGTLTQNRMTVTELHVGARHVWVEGSEFFGAESRLQPLADPDVGWLITLGALCNEAALVKESGHRSIEGSSTEQSIIRLALDAGFDPVALRSRYPLTDIAHRTEDHHFMVTTHRWAEQTTLLAVKGSPLEVLERCSHIGLGGAVVPLEESDRHRIGIENSMMAGGGLRVLGAACRWEEGEALRAALDDEPGLTWVGLFGLEDPLREEAKPLIESLQRAGIKTAVITGDQSLTAYHIGDKLGLSGDEALSILDATDLNQLSEAGLRNVVTRAHVFARLSPTQKLQVIQAYQSEGLSVMMVGDGFNDVLALKVSDVGVAMGIEGADLARQSADLVLEDDDLRAVMAAIAQGRSFYRNLRGSVRYLLTTSQTDLLLGISAETGLLNQDVGLGHAFWTNLVCLSLAHEPALKDDGRLTTPDGREGLLQGHEVKAALWDSAGMITCAGAAGGYGALRYGAGEDAGRLFMGSAAINQHLFARSCREGTKDADGVKPSGTLLHLIVGTAIGTQLAVVLFPGLGLSLRTFASSLADAAMLGLAGFSSRALLTAVQNRRRREVI